MEFAIELIKWLSLALVFLLGPVILIHEIGHFVSAKRAGVRVIEFGIGFPPRLLTLGQEKGTIVVDGEEMVLPPRFKLPPDLEVGQTVEVLSRVEADGSRRVVALTQTEAAPGREETAQGSVLRGVCTALRPGTRYSLNLLPIGGFVRMLGEEDPSDPQSLAAKPKRWRLLVISAGALVNLVAAFLILSAAYMTGVPDGWWVHVEQVLPDTAAQEAGLQTGDVLQSIDGEVLVDGPTQLRELIQVASNQPVTLGVMRDGEVFQVVATPQDRDGLGFLGIGMQLWPDTTSMTYYTLPQAFSAAVGEIVDVFVRLFHLPRMVAEGDVAPAEIRPTAMPGILQWLALALKQSFEWKLAFPTLQFTAMISMAVGLTNLLPLPGFDGGRMLFILIEAVRGRRVNPNTEAIIHMVGLAILLALSVVVIIQDIVNPLIPWTSLGQ